MLYNKIKTGMGVSMACSVLILMGLCYQSEQDSKKLGGQYRNSVQALEQTKSKLQEQNNQTKELLKQVEQLQKENDSIKQSNKELKEKNSSLEGVRYTVLNSVGIELKPGDVDLLQRLVECEAGAESMQGKIAVVNVVLNRVKSNKFPNTIQGVIYQRNQFEPVVTGFINNVISSKESKEAVKRALMGEKVIGVDILNFWAKWLDKNNDIWKHIDIVQTIGVHHFGREWGN